MRALLGLFLLLGVCPLTRFVQSPPPEIVTFTGNIQPCMLHEGCATFEWEIHGTGAIYIESGAVDEQGDFQPGGWDTQSDLPRVGSASFRIKIGNYAARLCVERLFSEPVCAVCNPFEPDGCS